MPAEDGLIATNPERRQQRLATDRAIVEQANGGAVRAAIGHLMSGRAVEAESVVRRHLAVQPNDVPALCLLGDLAARGGVHAEAERLFRLALSHAPLFTDAQINLARILALRDGVVEAITLLDEVVADEPQRWTVALQRLALLGQVGDYDRAAEGYTRLLADHPDRAEAWSGFGHLQKTLGRPHGSIEAYRRAIELDEMQGEAWWGLANLKTYVFDDAEVAHLERLAGVSDIDPAAHAAIHFALGKALEDRRNFAGSFQHYAKGNQLRRSQTRYDAAATSTETARSIGWFTADRFARNEGGGHPSADPIFIVGLPRSGSTLIEQILASHSLVEGTAELPYIPMLVHRLLAERWQERSLTFPRVLDALPPERFRSLGQAYLDAAATHRRDAAPFFIDKLPNNWSYIGFIRLILPNARIIDARREPMACCWSNYKQWFARGQDFSYDLSDLGRYYRDYLALTAHIGDVQPGVICRVIHERLIADPNNEIRQLLNDLRLPFEEACLNFHENSRPVRTASAQQVRRPISRDAIDSWRPFEPWLDELKSALVA